VNPPPEDNEVPVVNRLDQALMARNSELVRQLDLMTKVLMFMGGGCILVVLMIILSRVH
jgi:hypothetical protein